MKAESKCGFSIAHMESNVPAFTGLWIEVRVAKEAGVVAETLDKTRVFDAFAKCGGERKGPGDGCDASLPLEAGRIAEV